MNIPQKKLLGPKVLTKHLKKANIIFTHYFQKKRKRILPTSFYESVITLIPKLDNKYKKKKQNKTKPLQGFAHKLPCKMHSNISKLNLEMYKKNLCMKAKSGFYIFFVVVVLCKQILLTSSFPIWLPFISFSYLIS